MWISIDKYRELMKAKLELQEIIKFLESKRIYEELSVPLVQGKYFIAEKQNVPQVGIIWKIYRVDRLIKSQKPEATVNRSYVFDVRTEEAAKRLIDYLDEKIDSQLEKKSSLLLWLSTSHRMAKRVYSEDEYGNYFQLQDGAIPMWWINQEIERVAKGISRSKNEQTT